MLNDQCQECFSEEDEDEDTGENKKQEKHLS
jgi:hypothetical protein